VNEDGTGVAILDPRSSDLLLFTTPDRIAVFDAES
jgi:hypothetical protein